MEKIIIKNFLIFKDLELTINKFNILIGSQASGKSLLAKLVYFFKNSSELLKRGIMSSKSFDNIIDGMEAEFLEFFPSEYWVQKNSFSIEYYFDTVIVKLSSDFRKKNKIKIDFSKNVSDFYYECLDSVEKSKLKILEESEPHEEIDFNATQRYEINRILTRTISASSFAKFFNDSIFIPSSRSFFSTLNNNLWTLTDLDIIDIDPFMSRFGRAYEQAKFVCNIFNSEDGGFFREILSEELRKYDYANKIIKGEYREIDSKDWIIGKNYKVTLSRASSGQQEAFPMLMVLTKGSSKLFSSGKGSTFFIEEPEAHLFPEAQNLILSLLLLIKNIRKSDFFVTTHSPYILSALNNSIYASELIKKEKLTVDDYIEMSDGAYPIDYEDISAYSLESGRLVNIKDDEFKMIGGDILDSVSNEFGEVMDKLMELDN